MTDHTPDPDQPDDTGRPARTVVPRASNLYRAGMVAALAVAALALFLAIRSTNTDTDSPAAVNGRPDVVEHLVPRNGAEALQQAEVGIDLAAGYEGALILNGTAIPTDELRLVPEQNQIYFAPGPDKTFRALPSGTNCVTAVVWKSADGKGVDDLSFQWCFDVT